MYPDLLADENIDSRIIASLRNAGINVVSVGEYYSGAKDKDILHIAKQKGLVIITEDKDFGELVFSYKEANVGIIFLRYPVSDRIKISQNLIHVIKKFGFTLHKKFAVIASNKIRIRDI